KERGDMIEYILRDPRTFFLLVTSADPRRIEETFQFHEKLEEIEQKAHAFIVNRVTPQFSLSDLDHLDGADLREFIRERGAPETIDADGLFEQLETHYTALARLADRDRQSIQRLAERVGEELLQLVPVLGQDVHSIEDLRRLGQFLTPGEPEVPVASAQS
ncbi:MAG: hypothetical protein ABEN55_11565, partial [Bradymonadaceae bacterium]